MIYVVGFLTATAVALLVLAVASVPSGEARTLRRRLEELRAGEASYQELQERRRRQAKRERLETLLEAVGERMGGADQGRRSQTMRSLLRFAGYRKPNALTVFLASRLLLAAGFGVGALFLATVFPMSSLQRITYLTFGVLLGWMLPYIMVNRRRKHRQRQLQRALPDALDLLVVCVEAGLGLNQALQRVAQEMDRVSPAMSDELTLTTLEIRAGTPREEALRHLADRNGLDDVQSLTGMLIQTDRFGTSIAQALRVHADSLRDKRRQLAEEAAAKTSVKMLFPLVFFVFPAIFIALLGPAVFRMRDLFKGLGGP
ncbi:MAG: type II secretion system F family protein [Candidatus Palauibacterales bacterium]|nr:type II secretion system F family protein [Candidatus Palauibacterales bacterium]MDP2583637.1 type II secretion system F family protein [Candidatus Palauibacterales bacterium]